MRQTQAMPDHTRYWAIADELFSLYSEGRYEELLAAALAAMERLPQRPATTAYWVACGRCLTGDPGAGLEVLARAVEAGCFWAPGDLLNEPDLAPARGLEGFQEVASASRRLHELAQAAAGPKLLSFGPEGAARGTLIALHGAEGPAEFAPFWAGAAGLGWAVGVPQSSQVQSSDGFGWLDGDVAAGEVALAHAGLVEEHGGETADTVLAGFSQGGRWAVEWALAGAPFECRGFIGVGPSLSGIAPAETSRLISTGAERRVRGYLIVGERDWVLEPVRELAQAWNSQGVACELEVVPGVGHSPPPDMDDRLGRALDFVAP